MLLHEDKKKELNDLAVFLKRYVHYIESNSFYNTYPEFECRNTYFFPIGAFDTLYKNRNKHNFYFLGLCNEYDESSDFEVNDPRLFMVTKNEICLNSKRYNLKEYDVRQDEFTLSLEMSREKYKMLYLGVLLNEVLKLRKNQALMVDYCTVLEYYREKLKNVSTNTKQD